MLVIIILLIITIILLMSLFLSLLVGSGIYYYINKTVQEPNVQEPNVQEPNVQEPNVQEPNVQVSDVQEPNVQEPNVQEPNVQVSDVQEPDVQEPEIKINRKAKHAPIVENCSVEIIYVRDNNSEQKKLFKEGSYSLEYPFTEKIDQIKLYGHLQPKVLIYDNNNNLIAQFNKKNFGAEQIQYIFNETINNAHKIDIICGSDYERGIQDCGFVKIYASANYKYEPVRFGIGEYYEKTGERGMGVVRGKIASVKIPNGLKLELYKDKSSIEPSIIYTEDQPRITHPYYFSTKIRVTGCQGFSDVIPCKAILNINSPIGNKTKDLIINLSNQISLSDGEAIKNIYISGTQNTKITITKFGKILREYLKIGLESEKTITDITHNGQPIKEGHIKVECF